MANQIPEGPVQDLQSRPVGELDSDLHEIVMGRTDQICTGEIEGGKDDLAGCGFDGNFRRVEQILGHIEQTLGRIERAMGRNTVGLMHLPST